MSLAKLTGVTIKKMSTSVDGGYALTIDIPENNTEQAMLLFGEPHERTYTVEVMVE
jgi:hypothetical protein